MGKSPIVKLFVLGSGYIPVPNSLPPIIMVQLKMGVSPIGSLPFKYSHFPLHHDYGGKSKTITMWNFRTSPFFHLFLGKMGRP